MTYRRMACISVTLWSALADEWVTGHDQSDVGYSTESSSF
jgi:hypothetical protein